MNENQNPRPEDDDIDSRDKDCECEMRREGRAHPACPRHGIAASNARENRYWQRVGRD